MKGCGGLHLRLTLLAEEPSGGSVRNLPLEFKGEISRDWNLLDTGDFDNVIFCKLDSHAARDISENAAPL